MGSPKAINDMRKLLLVFAVCLSLRAQTTVTEPLIPTPIGAIRFTGVLTITAPDMTYNGQFYPGWSQAYSIVNGLYLGAAFSVPLIPNTGATPTGTSYAVRYQQRSGGPGYTRYWVIPASGPVNIAAVQTMLSPSPSSLFFPAQLDFSAIGGLVYGGPTTLGVELAPNTSVTRKYLSQIGNGTVATALTWETVVGGGGSGDAMTTNPLSQFSATTSAQLAGVISDETGSGLAVFGTSPNITTPTGIVKGDVGLGSVDNTSDAAKNAAVATLANKTLTSPVVNAPVGIVKADVGLGNVDNTSDATKDSSIATLTNKKLQDSTTTIIDNVDPTKALAFMVGAIATGLTRTVTAPNADTVLVQGSAAVTNQFITGISSTTGAITRAQPSFADVTGAVTDAQVPDNITITGMVAGGATLTTTGAIPAVTSAGTLGETSVGFTGPTGVLKTFTLPNASVSLAILGANTFTGDQTLPALTTTGGGIGVRLGGATSSFPALKRSSAALQIRLADDSADAVVFASNIKRGTGSPEAVVTGAVGDLYQRTDGGAATTIYVKESGIGNTGWVAGITGAGALPSCSNATTDKLLYNSTTQVWSCGSDQIGSGGTGITTLNTLTGTTQTFTDDTNVTVVSGGTAHVITWAGTLAKARQNATTVYNDAGNVYTSGTQDFAAAMLKIPTAAGLSQTASGRIGYDSTDNAYKFGVNGVSKTLFFTDTALQTSQLPALTGDVTSSAGSAATTLANIPTAVPMAGSLLATSITAPATPAAGKASVYVDSTSKNIAVKDDAGIVKHGVQTQSAVANSFVTAINDAGAVTVTQPAFSNLSGAATDAQVPNTITLDNLTQVTTRSHTDLTAIGTNTHAQIDTHVASTANPHSVTAAQVGNGVAQWNANQINSVALSGLATGILKNTISTGVPSIAVAGTDYVGGQATLTTVGAIPKVTGAGTLGESAVKDDGTNVSIMGRNVGIGTTAPGTSTLKIINPTPTTGATLVTIAKGAADSVNTNTLTSDASASFSGGLSVTGNIFGSSEIRLGAASVLFWETRTVLTSPLDGVLKLSNLGQNTFDRLQFGGTTSSFPSIKKVAAGLSARLADDSADAIFTSLNLKRGTGTPEAFITGAIGDVYQRTDGGSGTSAYIKESGVGNTGWVAVAPGNVTYQHDGTQVGSPRGTLNLKTGTGFTWTTADTGTKIEATAAVDTAIVTTKAVQQSGAPISGTTAGSSTVYTLALTPPLTAYATGMVLHPKFDENCGANPTLNVDALGARKLYKSNGTSDPVQIGAGECRALSVYQLRYDAALDVGAGGFVMDIGGGGSTGLGYALQYNVMQPWNLLASTTYYVGTGHRDVGFASAAGYWNYIKIYVPKTGTIKVINWDVLSDGVLASTENVAIYLRIDDSGVGETALTTTDNWSTNHSGSRTDLSIAVVQGNYIGIKIVTPAWVTNPTQMTMKGVIFIE